MRILHLLNDVTDRGNGIVNAAIDLAAGQIEEGHVVAIVSAGGGLESLVSAIGVEHFYLDQSRTAINILRALFGLRRHIKTFRPDVVHAHVRTGVVLGFVWSKLMRLPLLAHLHNIHEDESLVMALADRVIAVSDSVAATVIHSGIPQRKVRVVLNGPLGSPRMPSVSELPAANIRTPSIITVGGMNHRKGISELIRAFNEVAGDIEPLDLYLIGDGPDIETFRVEAGRSTFKERIHFEGFQEHPQRYMKACDVFVLASRRESFGLVLLEAREAGCAIVASDVDGIPEALDGGQAGLLVPVGDVSALVNSLRQLVGQEAIRVHWQARAKQGIERFSHIAMAKNVDRVYGELLQERRKAGQTRLKSGTSQ
jgi:glycosyltransferase involved in cell wall biosynthesis